VKVVGGLEIIVLGSGYCSRKIMSPTNTISPSFKTCFHQMWVDTQTFIPYLYI